MKKRILLTILSLSLLAAPVSATSSEAEVLTGAVVDIDASAIALNAGSTAADQVVVTDTILATIGAVDDYTDACKTLARFVLVLAGEWRAAMVAKAADDIVGMKSDLIVAIALFSYWNDQQGYIPTVINDCSIGL